MTNDAHMLQQLREGNGAALREFYHQNHQHLLRATTRVVRDQQLAEDVIQDTLLALPSALKGFQGRSGYRTFITSIAVNKSRHYVRAAVRARLRVERAAHEQTAPGHSSPTPSPEHIAQMSETSQMIAEALLKLSPAHQQVIQLCRIEGQSSQKAAESLGVPEGTVRTRLMHATRRLRQILEPVRVTHGVS